MTKKGNVMNQRFILFRRSGVFYYKDTTTGKRASHSCLFPRVLYFRLTRLADINLLGP
jgi:hypothetical protein